MNIIIFSDDNGVGVQVGEEKQYITDDLKQAIIGDSLDEVRALQATNQTLTNRLASIKMEIADLREIEIRYNIINSICADH